MVLWNMVDNCEFWDLKDLLIWDCIVLGVIDNYVRECLLWVLDLIFEKVLEIFRVVEVI